jgi:hypothetical protein
MMTFSIDKQMAETPLDRTAAPIDVRTNLRFLDKTTS